MVQMEKEQDIFKFPHPLLFHLLYIPAGSKAGYRHQGPSQRLQEMPEMCNPQVVVHVVELKPVFASQRQPFGWYPCYNIPTVWLG